MIPPPRPLPPRLQTNYAYQDDGKNYYIYSPFYLYQGLWWGRLKEINKASKLINNEDYFEWGKKLLENATEYFIP